MYNLDACGDFSFEIDFIHGMAGEKVVIRSFRGSTIVMGRLSIRPCLVLRIKRTWSPEHASCVAIARITGRLYT